MFDYRQNKQRLDDLIPFLVDQGFNWFVTVNYPRRLPGTSQQRDQLLMRHLRHWTVRILKKLYGRKFPARNTNNEFLYAAFKQIGPLLVKEHLHLLVRVPSPLWSPFKKNAAPLWKATDDVDVRFIGSRDEQEACVRYCSRDLNLDPDSIVLSNEFTR